MKVIDQDDEGRHSDVKGNAIRVMATREMVKPELNVLIDAGKVGTGPRRKET